MAAVGSWVDARAAGGEWRVRIEDLDRPREVAGAADRILRTLEQFGLVWDGAVVRQSERSAAYSAALARLEALGRVYPCSCSRADLESGAAGESRYPGSCREGPRRPGLALGQRLKTQDEPAVTVLDRIHGRLTQEVDAAVGDFLLRRRDGIWCYQLAVVVDDAEAGITDVVRGYDLWDNTPRQRLLQQWLELPAPRYLHLPLVLQPSGQKLSKSRAALAADPAEAPRVLTEVLGLLAHPPDRELAGAPVDQQLRWAIKSWNINNIRSITQVISHP